MDSAWIWLLIPILFLGAWTFWLTLRLSALRNAASITVKMVRFLWRFHGPELLNVTRNPRERAFIDAILKELEEEERGNDA